MLPFAWVSLQITGLLAAAVVVFARGDRQLAFTFVRSLPFTAVGALLFDYALRVAIYAANGFAGRPPAFGGAMAYGALIGVALTFSLLLRRRDVGAALDRVAPAFGVLVFFGRIGCLLEGCEYGRPTELPWAWHYPRLDYGVHPTALYEALVGLAAALSSYVVGRLGRRSGSAFASAALVYAAGRFAVEFMRADPHRGNFRGLTTGQAMSLFVASAVVVWLTREPPEARQAT